MVLKYGYVIGKILYTAARVKFLEMLRTKDIVNWYLGEQLNNAAVTGGKIITPTKTPEVINLSVVNSSRFSIFGTKPGKRV